MNFWLYIAIGLLAGFIAANFNPNGRLGLIGNLILGILAGFAGGYILSAMGLIFEGFVASALVPILSAIIILGAANFLDNKTK